MLKPLKEALALENRDAMLKPALDMPSNFWVGIDGICCASYEKRFFPFFLFSLNHMNFLS
jgi:hypothetical protein